MYIDKTVTFTSDEERMIETLMNEIYQRGRNLSGLLSRMNGYEDAKYEVKYEINVDASGDTPIFLCRFVNLDELQNRAAELEVAVKEYRACLEKLGPLAASLEKRLNLKN